MRPLGHCQRDCLYGNVAADDTSTPIIGQMHHSLMAHSATEENVLKLILKELINAKATEKNVMQ